MGNDEKISGIWWMSDKPDKHVSGDLLIVERKLELNGSFDDLKSRPIGIGRKSGLVSVRQDITIQGVAKKGGKKYTLEFFDEPSFSMSMPGYKADTYILGNIFEGDYFNNTENLSFERYYIEFPYLLDWVGESVISTQLEIIDNNKFGDTTIKVSSPKTIEVFKSDNLKLSFVITPAGVSIGPLVKEMNLAQNCAVKIEAVNKSMSLVEMDSIVTHLERFLIIAIGRSLEPTKYQAASGKGINSRTINIFPHTLKKKLYSKINIHNMNFGFWDIKADRQTIFEKWFADKDKYTDVFDLFSSIRSDTGKNLNNQFKDIVSAIEGYVSIDKGIKISLDKAIKTVNEVLAKNDRIISKDDRKKIRITRNKLSHIATIKPEDEKLVMNDEAKWLNFQKLLLLLEYSLLKNLGMREGMLTKFYEKHKTWS